MSEYENAWTHLEEELQEKSQISKLYEQKKDKVIDILMNTFELYMDAAREYASATARFGINGRTYDYVVKTRFSSKILKSPPVFKLLHSFGKTLFITEEGQLWILDLNGYGYQDIKNATPADILEFKNNIRKEFGNVYDMNCQKRISLGSSETLQIILKATFNSVNDDSSIQALDWQSPKETSKIKEEIQSFFINRVRNEQTKYR